MTEDNQTIWEIKQCEKKIENGVKIMKCKTLHNIKLNDDEGFLSVTPLTENA